MASEKLKEMLNGAIERELAVSIQYMWQHVQWSGVKHYAVSGEFEKIAIAEMKHAERIAERLWYLGGTPTTKPREINVGTDMASMVRFDIDAEAEAISFYKDIIRTAQAEGDITTMHMFEEILGEEEEHHDFFTSVGEDKEIQ